MPAAKKFLATVKKVPPVSEEMPAIVEDISDLMSLDVPQKSLKKVLNEVSTETPALVKESFMGMQVLPESKFMLIAKEENAIAMTIPIASTKPAAIK